MAQGQKSHQVEEEKNTLVGVPSEDELSMEQISRDSDVGETLRPSHEQLDKMAGKKPYQ